MVKGHRRYHEQNSRILLNVASTNRIPKNFAPCNRNVQWIRY